VSNQISTIQEITYTERFNLVAQNMCKSENVMRKNLGGLNMSIGLDVLNGLTTKTYGFMVCDWDRRLRDSNLNVLGKHNFSTNASDEPIDGAHVESMNLHGLGAEKMGEVFNNIFQGYQNCKIGGTSFKPKAIYLRLNNDNTIPDQPFLFVAGIKV
jgi:hypothetical protein